MGCITLLSDFGLKDASVAIAKGILLQHAPGVPVIDISHEVQPYNAGQTAYLLASAYKNFPAGTCHVLLFNIFSETQHGLVLSEYKGWYFLSPDNSVIPMALGAEPEQAWLCMELKTTDTFSDWLHAAGDIIHLLQTNKPAGLDLQPYQLKTGAHSHAVYNADGIKCEVIHIDSYENVVINITRQQLASYGDRPFRVQFTGTEEIDGISNDYNEVRAGYKLCRFNSSGYLEICINRGKAASLFGLRQGGKQNDIKILFE